MVLRIRVLKSFQVHHQLLHQIYLKDEQIKAMRLEYYKDTGKKVKF